MSQRRIARVLVLNRKTIAKKLIFLARTSRLEFDMEQASSSLKEIIEFDDLETFEHTKCKPLSVILAVEHKTRKILGFEVSQMPSKGRLAKLSVKKYGFRKDLRFIGRKALFERLKLSVHPNALIKSDSNPHYPWVVKNYFPNAIHQTYLGQRGASTAQGELKKIKFDPLFSLNHTCAKFRADVNRLIRKTWCTTKKPDRLSDHLAIYVQYHNENLRKAV
jgi:hypothetical protein